MWRELCGRKELGAHRARLEQAVKEADKAVDMTPLVEQLRGLLAPDECELLGLDHDNGTLARRLVKHMRSVRKSSTSLPAPSEHTLLQSLHGR